MDKSGAAGAAPEESLIAAYQRSKLLVELHAALGILFRPSEERLGVLRVGLEEGAVANLRSDEVLEGARRGADIPAEALAFLEGRIVAVQRPVAGVDSVLHDLLAVAHIHPVVDAGGICEDD